MLKTVKLSVKQVLLLFYTFFILNITFAQVYIAKNYTVSDGLPFNAVLNISESKNGLLWLTMTDASLCRFDGKKFYPFRIADSLHPGQIYKIKADKRGNTWFVGEGGIFYLHDGVTSRIPLIKLHDKKIFLNVFEDSKGNIWAGGMGVLIRISYNTKGLPSPQAYYPFTQEGNFVTSFEELNGKLFFGTSLDGVWEIDETFSLKNSISNTDTSLLRSTAKLFKGKDGILRVYNYKYIYKIENSRLVREVNFNGVGPYDILYKDSIVFSAKSEVQLFHLKPNAASIITTIPEIKGNQFFCFFEASDGNIWIGHDAGLSRLSFYNNLAGEESMGFPHNTNLVRKLDNNRLLLTDVVGDFYEYQIGYGVKKLPWKSQIKNTLISRYNLQGKEIINTNDGYTYIINDQIPIIVRDPSGKFSLNNYYPFAIQTGFGYVMSSDNSFWICNFGDIVNIKELNYTIHTDSNFASQSVNFGAIAGNKKGDKYLASPTGGIWQYSNNKFTKLGVQDKYLQAFDIICTQNDDVWAVLGKNGLLRIRKNESGSFDYKYINAKNSNLPDYNYNSISLDSAGNFWLLHNEGIVKASVLNTDSVTFYTPVFDEYVRKIATYQTKPYFTDNTLWLNGTTGVVAIKNFYEGKNEIIDKQRKPVITSVFLKGDDHDYIFENNNVEFNYNQNAITISFSALNYNNRSGISYEYILQGNDSKWERTIKDEVAYTNLPAGKYVFKIKVTGCPDEASFYFKILPPWYNTWWAYSLFALLIGLLIFIFFRIWLKRARKKAEYKAILIDTELKALRAQLNPHFIQNTFDLMAGYVEEGSPEKSVGVIRKVSTYLRQVLYKSDKSIISLEDELEFIEEYMKVQQMVHPGLFEYTLNVDPAVDTFGIMLPSMLLQPIVENCIKHGFAGMVENGKIDVDVLQNNGRLEIIVTDNGKGLIKDKISETSKGFMLTKKRISLLAKGSKLHDDDVSLTNRQDGFRGTIFKVSIKLND